MQLAWKTLSLLGFILFAFFSGCGDPEPTVDDRVQQAESLLDAGQIDSAILLLEGVQETHPERVDVLEALAFAYAAKGDPMLASMNFLKIAELVPTQTEYLLYAAESLLEANDVKGAIDQYRAYLHARPDDRAIWVALADLYRSRGRTTEALDAYLASEQLEPRAQQRIALGRLYLQSGNLAQAQVWFARAIDGDQEFRDEALLGLLETAVRAKRYADAEALVTQLDEEFPGRLSRSDLDSVRDQLTEWRRRQDAARKAVAALESPTRERTVEEAPVPSPGQPAAEEAERAAAVPEAETLAGAEPVSQTSGPEAEEPVEAEEPSSPGTAPAPTMETTGEDARHLARARENRKAGMLAEAIRHYKRALVLNDNQPEVWAELSEAYLENGDDRWAQATASEAVRRDPGDPRLVLQYIRAGQRTMSQQRLLEEMETAYRSFPNQPQIVLVLARAYRDAGNRRNAVLLYRKFLELVPQDYPDRAQVETELGDLGD